MPNLTSTEPSSRLTISLGVTQTIAWASSYYLIAILATPIAAELSVSTVNIYAAFSAALILTAIVGPMAGRLIDQFGGKPVLLCTNVIFAIGLCILSVADSIVVSWLGWSRGRTASYLNRPHTDPSERNYRTRLLSYPFARVEH